MSSTTTRLVSDEAVLDARSRKKKAEQAKKQLTPALVGVVDHEASVYAKGAASTLDFFWERGQVISNVSQNRSIKGDEVVDYGPNAVDLLTDALGMSRSRVYRMLTFFQMYTREELADVVERARDVKYELGWGHIQEVLCIKNGKGADPARPKKDMIEVAIVNLLSVRALREEVMARYGEKAAKKVPKPKSAAKKMCTDADKFIERFDGYTASLFSASGAESLEVEDLREVQTRIISAGERMQQVVDRISTKIQAKTPSTRKVAATARA